MTMFLKRDVSKKAYSILFYSPKAFAMNVKILMTKKKKHS